MQNTIPKLHETLAIIYEMEGMAGVENYARANHIPVNVCRRLLDAYEPVAAEPKLEGEMVPDSEQLDGPGPPMHVAKE